MRSCENYTAGQQCAILAEKNTAWLLSLNQKQGMHV